MDVVTCPRGYTEEQAVAKTQLNFLSTRGLRSALLIEERLEHPEEPFDVDVFPGAGR